jgi:hypothetical protein
MEDEGPLLGAEVAQLTDSPAGDAAAVPHHASSGKLSASASSGSGLSAPLLRKQAFSFSAHHGPTVAPGALLHPDAWRALDKEHHTGPPIATTLKVVYVATAFAVMFTASNVAQTFLTTLFPKYGFYSFAIVYMAFAVSALLAPNIGGVIGLVPALVLGASTYAAMIAAFLTNSGFWLLLVCNLYLYTTILLWLVCFNYFT